MEADAFLAMQVADAGDGRSYREIGNRMDPRELVTNPNEFHRSFRMSAEHAAAIVELIEEDLVFPNQRGKPLSPMQRFCATMLTFGGANFQRVTALAMGVSQFAVRDSIIATCKGLLRLKPEVVTMPTAVEMETTAARLFDRFGLDDFALGVDGCIMRFEDQPRGLPAEKHPQLFWNRKQDYALNVQFVCNDDRVCDLDVGWHGSAHDSKVWNRSAVKDYMEEQRRFLIAGDSGYPISDILMKPYSEAECQAEVERDGTTTRRRFNAKLSGLRTVMSEHHFGRMKKRFPILRQLRCHLGLSQEIIVACTVVYNLLSRWRDPEPEDQIDFVEHEPIIEPLIVQDLDDQLGRRLRGQAKRDAMRLAMQL